MITSEVPFENTLPTFFAVKRNILGHRKDYWGPLEALEHAAPESAEIVKSVQNLPNLKYCVD